jgi:outer membrane protein TolC
MHRAPAASPERLSLNGFVPMKHFLNLTVAALWLLGASVPAAQGAENADTNALPAWLSQPLTLPDALLTAEAQNARLRQARKELEAQYGVAVQSRAVALPRLQATGSFQWREQDRIESFGGFSLNNQSWNTGFRIVQSIYEGGRIQSGLRTARLTRDAALLNYQTALADTLLRVREAYDLALFTSGRILVQEASVKLLEKELEDTRRRFEAGVVPQFNVLRAETELGNARPRLSRARNQFRISKQRLVNELGYDVPRTVLEDIPLQLAGRFDAVKYEQGLSDALGTALEKRTELASLRKNEELRREGVTGARAGWLPALQAFGGWDAQSLQFQQRLDDPVTGWNLGALATWDIFDGNLTRGRVQEAKALREAAAIAVDDAMRNIEVEVRSAYSTMVEAWEVLQSQQKVTETAEEALRLANSRVEAGTATQLDVLSAQTALTDARDTYVSALYEYSLARARLERATGTMVGVEEAAAR